SRRERIPRFALQQDKRAVLLGNTPIFCSIEFHCCPDACFACLRILLRCATGLRRLNPQTGALWWRSCTMRLTSKGELMSRPAGTYAIFETSQGNIVIRLLEKEAPKTVENFIGLAEGTKEFKDARSGQKKKGNYYDGLVFHRVIPDFMIQGGCPEGSGRGGPGYTFGDEFHPSLKHSKAGKLSMANAGPGTNGSQFFITVAATPWLDNKHTIFGEVVEGQDIAEQISKVRRDSSHRPRTPVSMNKVHIERVQ